MPLDPVSIRFPGRLYPIPLHSTVDQQISNSLCALPRRIANENILPPPIWFVYSDHGKGRVGNATKRMFGCVTGLGMFCNEG